MSPTRKKKKAAPAKAKPAKSPAKSAKPKASTAAPAPAVSSSGPQVDVLVWLRAKKGKETALARALKTLAGPSRAEQGCLTFDLYHPADRPADFFIHEIWSRESDLANHRQMPHFKHWAGLQGAILDTRRRYLAE